MAEKSLAAKLHLKSGDHVAVLHAPRSGKSQFASLPPRDTLTTRLGKTHDVILAFFEKRREVQSSIGRLKASLAKGGALWIAYPKLTAKRDSDQSRDILWAELKPEGLRPVSLIAVDETWSAMRFKPLPR
jgi:hypothetical protein